LSAIRPRADSIVDRADDVLPVTVVLPVRNEERNLPGALASVHWADELIVVDSASADGTRACAEAVGAQVIDFHWDGRGPRKRAWLLEHVEVRNPWVLMLDADERVTPALRDEIAVAIARDDHDGYYIDREMVFMGRRLRCFNPNWNPRLFRPGTARMEDLGLSHLEGTGDNEIHEHIQLSGRVGFLRETLLHNDYRGLTTWIDRHNGYATWEAHIYRRYRSEPIGVGPIGFLRLDAFRRKRVLRRVWVRLPFRPAIRFFVWYLLRGGFRDGRAGFTFCVLMAHYEYLIGLKVKELDA
jgi:glycosyltransferase involved in cell wall biosynthesis